MATRVWVTVRARLRVVIRIRVVARVEIRGKAMGGVQLRVKIRVIEGQDQGYTMIRVSAGVVIRAVRVRARGRSALGALRTWDHRGQQPSTLCLRVRVRVSSLDLVTVLHEGPQQPEWTWARARSRVGVRVRATFCRCLSPQKPKCAPL